MELRRLNRRDILDLEERLRASLARVLTFGSHAVYFPQEDVSPEPVWLEDEATLLIPLPQIGPVDPQDGKELLGVFAARQVSGVDAALIDRLPGIVDICLENLALYKTACLDPSTGLATRHVFVKRVSREIAAIQSAFAGGDDSPAGGCVGVLAVRLAPLRRIAREHGQTFAETLGRKLAEAFKAALPEGCLAARSGDTSFAAFLPAGNRNACEQAVAAVITALDAVHLPSPLSRQPIGLMVRVGFAVYPQDMDGVIVGRVPYEQAQRLLQRAALAASVAARSGEGRHMLRSMAYGRILPEGGRVLRPLPLSRLVVSLGRTVGAREGQRFAIWASAPASAAQGNAPVYRGELSLVKVHQEEAEAEVLHLGEPGSPPAPGDVLTLLPESGDAVPSEHTAHPQDPETGLLRHGDFLARLAGLHNACSRFGLVLVHLDGDTRLPEGGLREAADMVRARFGIESGAWGNVEHKADVPGDGAPGAAAVIGGRYGHHTLAFFHAEAAPDALHATYADLSAVLAARLEMRTAAGIAAWPFLRFRPADMPECARKALEYALLLPAPHVGVFDTLALNISADKKHCLGDVFGAIEEYKLALLADEDNALAWNSLGVCLAGLGRHAEARHYFEEALRRTPDDAALAYNLGAVCLNLGDLDAAGGHFDACLRGEPEHLYAMVRLGQLAEQRGDMHNARAFYLQAGGLSGGSGLPFRHLARMVLREGHTAAAREHLHQALQRNPRDAVALQLMAGLYLDGGEDPQLAESLARHSVALSPERKSAWLVLARALERQNRHEEARQAHLRAGEL